MMKVITETHHEITLNSLIVCSSLSNLLDDFDFKIHVTVVELVTYIMIVLHCYINIILLLLQIYTLSDITVFEQMFVSESICMELCMFVHLVLCMLSYVLCYLIIGVCQ